MPTLVYNKHARYEYTILETFEAGVSLTGAEVKSVRNGSCKLDDAFVVFQKNAPMLLNAHITPYRFAADHTEMNAKRSRELLLHKKEIAYLRGKTGVSGLTIVPVSLYTKGRQIKIEIALVKGKKLFEKKEVKKKRDLDRDMRRDMKG